MIHSATKHLDGQGRVRWQDISFEAFRDAYRFQGPERIPPESLEPGS